MAKKVGEAKFEADCRSLAVGLRAGHRGGSRQLQLVVQQSHTVAVPAMMNFMTYFAVC